SRADRAAASAHTARSLWQSRVDRRGGGRLGRVGRSGASVLVTFTDHVVFITGASSGIGAALAREFAKPGASLVLAARRTDRLEKLASELGRNGRRAIALACDVTRDGDLERAAAAVRDAFGRIDVVVANAGFSVVGTFERLTLDDYRRQFETNVFGV